MSRNYKPEITNTLLPVAVMAFAAFAALVPLHAEAGENDCTATKFTYPTVEQACKSGGRKDAKKVMMAAIKKAKAAGKDLKCSGCHEDMKSFKLKSNAVADLKPWI